MVVEIVTGKLEAAALPMKKELVNNSKRKKFWRLPFKTRKNLAPVGRKVDRNLNLFIRIIVANLTKSNLRRFLERYLKCGLKMLRLGNISRNLYRGEVLQAVMLSFQNRSSRLPYDCFFRNLDGVHSLSFAFSQ